MSPITQPPATLSAASRPPSVSPRSVTFISSVSDCRPASGREKVTASAGPPSRLRAVQPMTANGVDGSSPTAAMPGPPASRPNCHQAPAPAAATASAATQPITALFAIEHRPFVMTGRDYRRIAQDWGVPGGRSDAARFGPEMETARDQMPIAARAPLPQGLGDALGGFRGGGGSTVSRSRIPASTGGARRPAPLK
ncbi:hypothetical protein METUNv1_01489 [Methyloversatilis universalis FAM5]|uniref:Uncharacterized protein n=1 Tax=Methyloversatilis universalis (strain ATCC BAA-1314 / DSM 25237 / JCM 13912 / CCUG 52030 / FAM5) TaxID=1000565 RepID=F5RB50_METUF|nr:hypothetical protein METUNv1_01489 [Methyloversatilis universalis FAM5]